MTDDDLIQYLRTTPGWPTLGNAAADRIEALIAERDLLAELLDEAVEILRQCTWSTIYRNGQYIDREDFVDRADATLAKALAERDAQIMQIILDDVGYTYEQLGEEAREKLPTPAKALERVRANAFDPYEIWCFLTGKGTNVPEHRKMFDRPDDFEMPMEHAFLANDLKAYAAYRARGET